MKVSLIVPVFNVAPYLEKCLNSISNQTYENLEVILVNDGSEDESGLICDKFASNYRNVFVIHQDNQGLSVARNTGVLHSSGDYVTFVDSDDVITEDYVEYLMNMIVEFNADLSIGGIRKIYGLNEISLTNFYSDSRECYDSIHAFEELCYGKKFGLSACAKMFKKSTLLSYPFPKGRIYEDFFTIPYLIADSDRIAYGNKPIYFYYCRENSITNKMLSRKRIKDGEDAGLKLLNYAIDNLPNSIDAAISTYVNHFQYYLNGAVKNRTEYIKVYKYVKAKIEPYIKTVLINPKERIQTKIEVAVIAMGAYPSLLFYKLLAMKKNMGKKNIK